METTEEKKETWLDVFRKYDPEITLEKATDLLVNFTGFGVVPDNVVKSHIHQMYTDSKKYFEFFK